MKIQSFEIWRNGEFLTVDYILLHLISDNLVDKAVLKYSLFKYPGDNFHLGVPVIEGHVVIEGIDYENWGSEIPVNVDAYNIVLSKLNLTKV